MSEEFDLSHKELVKLGDGRGLYFKREDVKEAIRLIKLNPEKIDEIVGNKLI